MRAGWRPAHGNIRAPSGVAIDHAIGLWRRSSGSVPVHPVSRVPSAFREGTAGLAAACTPSGKLPAGIAHWTHRKDHMKKVLFVCAGNAGRSQMAETVFRRTLEQIEQRLPALADLFDRLP